MTENTESQPVVDENTTGTSLLSSVYNDIIILSVALFLSMSVALITKSPVVVRFFFVFSLIYGMVRILRYILSQRYETE